MDLEYDKKYETFPQEVQTFLDEHKPKLQNLFGWIVPPALRFTNKECKSTLGVVLPMARTTKYGRQHFKLVVHPNLLAPANTPYLHGPARHSNSTPYRVVASLCALPSPAAKTSGLRLEQGITHQSS